MAIKTGKFKCEEGDCERSFPTAWGLHVHRGLMHKGKVKKKATMVSSEPDEPAPKRKTYTRRKKNGPMMVVRCCPRCKLDLDPIAAGIAMQM